MIKQNWPDTAVHVLAFLFFENQHFRQSNRVRHMVYCYYQAKER